MRTNTGLLFGLASVVSAVKYGYNHVTVNKDTEIVDGAFPAVEDIELLSPAFLTPDIRQPGFSDGTQGPSSQEDMGELPSRIGKRLADFKQRHSSKIWRIRMST